MKDCKEYGFLFCMNLGPTYVTNMRYDAVKIQTGTGLPNNINQFLVLGSVKKKIYFYIDTTNTCTYIDIIPGYTLRDKKKDIIKINWKGLENLITFDTKVHKLFCDISN